MEVTVEQTKAIQAIEAEMFRVFTDICRQLDLQYYLWGGTLLGAVRHKGFIPWDDDIDVGMPRKDYDKFLKEAPALLPEHLFLQTYQTDPEYPHVFAKIRNSNTTFLEKAIRKRNMNHGIFIDIFPLDGYSNKEAKCLKNKLQKVLIDCRISYAFDYSKLGLPIRILRLISKLFYPSIKKAQVAKEKLHRAVNSSTYIANYSGTGGERDIVPAEWYAEGVEVTFEGMLAIAPCEYHKVLTKQYGNYMELPPVEKRVTHHYTDIIDTEKSYRYYMTE